MNNILLKLAIGATALTVVAGSALGISVTSVTGMDTNATMYGSVRYRNLNAGGQGVGGEVYVGQADLGVGANRREIDFYGLGGNWFTNGNGIVFSYDPGTGVESTTVTVSGGSFSQNYTNGAPEVGKPVNYILLTIVERGDPPTPFAFTISDLNGNDLGTFNSTNGSWLYWAITDSSLFQNGFTLTATLDLSGIGNCIECDKVQFDFGYSPPAPPVDTTPPSITCPDNVTVAADVGVCFATGVVLGTPTATDDSGSVTVTNDAPAQFPIGTNVVTWTATDPSGNSNSCPQLVIVCDTQPPAITCPADVIVNADTGECYASGVALGIPTATDNCSVASVTNDAPSQFPVGTNVVTWTATDSSGNNNTCQQRVVVVAPIVRLSIVLQGMNAIISWPKTCGDLKQTPSLTPPATWSATTNAPVLVGTNYQVTVAVVMTNMFYRLQRSP